MCSSNVSSFGMLAFLYTKSDDMEKKKKNEKKSVRHPQPKPANNYAELLKLTVVHQFLGILELPLETKDTPHN